MSEKEGRAIGRRGDLDRTEYSPGYAALTRAAEVRSDWPPFAHNFYRDLRTGEWIYRYAEERIVAAVRVLREAADETDTA